MKETEEFIRDYYNQLLEADQQAEFEERYQTDAEFKAMADAIELEVVAIREHGRSTLKTNFADWEEESGEQTTDLKQMQFSPWKIGIAASVFLAAGLYLFLWAPQTGDELYTAYYQPYQNFEYTAVRDEVPDSLILKHRAYANYDQGNYKDALYYFDQLVEAAPDHIPNRFFRGMCLFERIEYEKALKEYQLVAAANHGYYSDAAMWYAALIHLRHEKYDKVKVFLTDLAGRKGEYQEKSKLLLGELD